MPYASIPTFTIPYIHSYTLIILCIQTQQNSLTSLCNSTELRARPVLFKAIEHKEELETQKATYDEDRTKCKNGVKPVGNW